MTALRMRRCGACSGRVFEVEARSWCSTSSEMFRPVKFVSFAGKRPCNSSRYTSLTVPQRRFDFKGSSSDTLFVLPKGTRQMFTTEKPLDIVIKTRARDLVPFLQLQTDLGRHSRLHGRIYVIVPRHE